MLPPLSIAGITSQPCPLQGWARGAVSTSSGLDTPLFGLHQRDTLPSNKGATRRSFLNTRGPAQIAGAPPAASQPLLAPPPPQQHGGILAAQQKQQQLEPQGIRWTQVKASRVCCHPAIDVRQVSPSNVNQRCATINLNGDHWYCNVAPRGRAVWTCDETPHGQRTCVC